MTEPNKMSEDHINMIAYFWQERGDLERYVSWEKILPQLEKVHPELIQAWTNYKVSIKILDAVVEKLANDYDI